MSNFVVWQKPTFEPARTVDRSLGSSPDSQQSGVGNAGTPYPFKPSNDGASAAYGGNRVGAYGHDQYLRLIPFPKPPRLTPGTARSAVGQSQNPLGASRSRSQPAPNGGQ